LDKTIIYGEAESRQGGVFFLASSWSSVSLEFLLTGEPSLLTGKPSRVSGRATRRLMALGPPLGSPGHIHREQLATLGRTTPPEGLVAF
jgi:hypothetical protein